MPLHSEEFEWSLQEEPHRSRRQDLLKEFPEVKVNLGTKNWTLTPIVIGANIVQFGLAYCLRESPWWAVAIVAYTIGGIINHGLTLAMHELSHNMASKNMTYNRVLGLLSNIPLGIPSFATFKRYHLEHHKYQGEEGIDVDVPTEWEGTFFVGPLLKTIWCICQPAFYALRPMVVLPKPPTAMEGMNWAVQVAVDATVWYLWGTTALVYLLASSLLGLGLHPMAGHFIAEHYTFVNHMETYSYYGPLNWFSFNVGYHNEHHDFPNVPGTHLPAVRAVSHRAYDDLPTHSSWIKVIWRYITNPSITPFNRVKRNTVGGAEALEMD